MTYKDTTFCDARECKHFGPCHRSLTDEVLKQAKKWFGGPNPPICQFSEPTKLQCYEPNIRSQP